MGGFDSSGNLPGNLVLAINRSFANNVIVAAHGDDKAFIHRHAAIRFEKNYRTILKIRSNRAQGGRHRSFLCSIGCFFNLLTALDRSYHTLLLSGGQVSGILLLLCFSSSTGCSDLRSISICPQAGHAGLVFLLALFILVDFELSLIHLVLILTGGQQDHKRIEHEPHCQGKKNEDGNTKTIHAGKYSKIVLVFKQRICQKICPFLAYSLDFCLQV